MACHTIPWARKILIACPLLLLVSVSSALAPGYVLHEERQTPFTSTIERRRLDPNVPIPVRIGLKQNEESMANAEAWLMSVSDPDSKDYGRFWTQDEVIELFKPTDDTLKTVTDWLSSNGVEEFTHSDNKLFFAFDAPTSQVERMLQTKVYAHSRSDSPAVLAACDQYYLPDYLRQHIDYITPGVRESDITDRVQSEILGRSAGKVISSPCSGMSCFRNASCGTNCFSYKAANPRLRPRHLEQSGNSSFGCRRSRKP